MYYIRNNDPYFSSHDNINTNKRICLIAVFTITNELIRGAGKETTQWPGGLLKFNRPPLYINPINKP